MLDGLRRGQGVHVIAVRAEHDGVIRRGRADSESDTLIGRGNTGCVEEIGCNYGLVGFGGKGVFGITLVIRQRANGRGLSNAIVCKSNMAVINIGHGRDRKLLARFRIGRGHGQRLDGVLDIEAHGMLGREGGTFRACGSVPFESLYGVTTITGLVKL